MRPHNLNDRSSIPIIHLQSAVFTEGRGVVPLTFHAGSGKHTPIKHHRGVTRFKFPTGGDIGSAADSTSGIIEIGVQTLLPRISLLVIIRKIENLGSLIAPGSDRRDREIVGVDIEALAAGRCRGFHQCVITDLFPSVTDRSSSRQDLCFLVSDVSWPKEAPADAVDIASAVSRREGRASGGVQHVQRNIAAFMLLTGRNIIFNVCPHSSGAVFFTPEIGYKLSGRHAAVGGVDASRPIADRLTRFLVAMLFSSLIVKVVVHDQTSTNTSDNALG